MVTDYFSNLDAFFSCLIALARTSNSMGNDSAKSGHLLFLILEEMLSVLHHWWNGDISCELVTYGPFVVVHSLYTHLVESFFMDGCWILWNIFSGFTEMIVIFIFHSVNVVYHIDWFANVEPSLNPWNKFQ